MGYPDRENERQVLSLHRVSEPVEELQPAIGIDQVVQLQNAAREVTIDDAINEYLLDIVAATRESDELHVGVSTRGVLCLYRAAQALAIVEGRDYVVPDDVKKLCVPVLSHRVITKGYLHGGQRDAIESLMRRLVDEVPVPA